MTLMLAANAKRPGIAPGPITEPILQSEIESILFAELDAAHTRFRHAPQAGAATTIAHTELLRALERFSNFVLDGSVPPDFPA
jgi:hypothetical protein